MEKWEEEHSKREVRGLFEGNVYVEHRHHSVRRQGGVRIIRVMRTQGSFWNSLSCVEELT